MEASGLVRRRESGGYYDAFRGRLMFPIQNEKGNVIAFGGRALRDADEPKYLNSPETPIYLKKSVLYNLHRAKDGMRKKGRAILVEGYMDVIGVFSAGVNEVVASCGTALTNLQVRAMHRHADTVVVNFDSDTAGQNAAEKSIQLLLEESLYVHVLELDGGLDPDEYVKAHGADQYVARLDRAETYFHWLADRARKRFDLRSAEGRVDALKFLLPHVLKVRDKIERVSVANDLAEYLRLDKDLILDQFRKAATDRKSAAPSRPREVLPDVEKILLDALIRSEAARQEILPQLAESALVERLTGQRIFHALLNAAPDGAGFDFSHFENQLTEPEKILLHDAISSDGIEEEQVLLTQATACLAKLEQAQIREEIQELRRRVQEAERQGSIEEAIRLTVALGDLEKRAAQQASAAGKTAL
jgi:DNA primase